MKIVLIVLLAAAAVMLAITRMSGICARHEETADPCEHCLRWPECSWLLDEGVIPEEKCIGCMLNWLKQPAEEADG